jgi:DNA polymerase-3 subunit beta
MRINIEKSNLFEGVQRVQNVVDKKNTIPVLSNILLEAEMAANVIQLTATNLEVGISTKLPVSESTEGSITVPAQKIFEILRELPEAPLSLTVDENNWISIECAKSNFRLAGLPKTDFPELPLFSSQDVIVFQQPVLKEMISKTAFAVSHDESRYALTGVLFSVNQEELSMVATDGHRLAVIKRAHNMEFGATPVEVVIPLKAITEVKKLCETDDMISVNLSESQIAFRREDTVLVSRLIDAQFPDYHQVIPNESRFIVALDRQQLSHAVRRVSLLCGDSRLIKFNVNNQQLRLSSTDPNLGEAEESMPVELLSSAAPNHGDVEESMPKEIVSSADPNHGEVEENIPGEYEGEDITIGFNARYVLDFLSVVSGEKIHLGLNDSLSPGLFTSDAEEDSGFSCVIMPMRV